MPELSVSVIMTTYNRAHLVERALGCVLDQIRPCDEVIVVDDGSTDSTQDTLSPYTDRIRYFRRENAGQSAGTNFAIDQSEKDLIAFLDDDDEWLPNKLELQRKVMEARPDVLYSFTSFVHSFSDGSERRDFLVDGGEVFEAWKAEVGPGVPFSSLADLPSGHEDFQVFVGDEYAALMRTDYKLGAVQMVRREAGIPHIYYPEDLQFCEDWESHAKLAKVGIGAYLNCDLYRWWEHPGFRAADLGFMIEATARLAILQRIWASDPEFMAEHGDEVRARMDDQHLERVRAFLLGGDPASARNELALFSGAAPVQFRFLSSLPAPLVRSILGARRTFRRISGLDGEG